MAQAMTLVGLDVHARQTYAAVFDRETGELRGWRLRVALEEVVPFLAGLPVPVLAVYEAGPTGFGLARAAAERGIEVRVVAPGGRSRGGRATGSRLTGVTRSGSSGLWWRASWPSRLWPAWPMRRSGIWCAASRTCAVI